MSSKTLISTHTRKYFAVGWRPFWKMAAPWPSGAGAKQQTFFFFNILGDCARFNPLYMLKKKEREKARIDISVMNVEKIKRRQ